MPLLFLLILLHGTRLLYTIFLWEQPTTCILFTRPRPYIYGLVSRYFCTTMVDTPAALCLTLCCIRCPPQEGHDGRSYLPPQEGQNRRWQWQHCLTSADAGHSGDSERCHQ